MTQNSYWHLLSIFTDTVCITFYPANETSFSTLSAVFPVLCHDDCQSGGHVGLERQRAASLIHPTVHSRSAGFHMSSVLTCKVTSQPATVCLGKRMCKFKKSQFPPTHLLPIIRGQTCLQTSISTQFPQTTHVLNGTTDLEIGCGDNSYCQTLSTSDLLQLWWQAMVYRVQTSDPR